MDMGVQKCNFGTKSKKNADFIKKMPKKFA